MYIDDDDHTLYLETEEACTVAGISNVQMYDISDDELSSHDHPEHSRKYLFEAGDVFELRRRIERNDGSLDSRTFRSYDDVVFDDEPVIREIIVLMDQLGYDLDDYDLELPFSDRVPAMIPSSDDLSERERDRLLSFVEDRCFGHADLSCEECVEHCQVTDLCLDERNERIAEIGRELESERVDQRVEDLDERELEDDLKDDIASKAFDGDRSLDEIEEGAADFINDIVPDS